MGKYQGLLNKSELKQASLDDQIAPGDQIGRPDFHILVMSKIWSPIRSPERLVVDLVVVDAVTLSNNDVILRSEGVKRGLKLRSSLKNPPLFQMTLRVDKAQIECVVTFYNAQFNVLDPYSEDKALI